VTVSPEIATGSTRVRVSAIYIIELAAIAFIYFWLVKLGLTLASINASASPIWPATGFALAILLLRGYRVWPAIFVGAFLANVSSAGSIYTSAAIAIGNSLEGVVGAFLINRWSGGVRTFTTPARIVKFALISTAATAISPAIGVSSLSFAGYAEWAKFGPIFMTWWLGDLAGALVVAPVLVLWADRPLTRAHPSETIAVFVVAASIGLIAFSPIIEQTVNRTPLAFLAVAPLVWTALRRDPRDTATAALILAGFAVWGTSFGGGPFSWAGFNESFVLLVMFIVSTAIPSLMLSAMAAERQASHATLERKVQERTHELELANLAKSRLIAVASHDLRQPLQTLFMLNGVLRRLATDSHVATAIAGQQNAIKAMSELLDSLLDISKLEAGATKPQITDVDLGELFDGLRVEFAEIAATKGLRLEILGSDETARTDPKLLGQILRNLLSNALKFTHEGSVRMQCVREAGQLRIDVTDTGRGIDSEHMPHIFEEFYQAGGMPNTAREGHGLGLSIVHRLIQILGHQIRVGSTVGEGSNFSIVLPVGSPRTRVAPPAKASSQEIRIDQAHVMVVEDDASVLSGICSLLETVGYRVTGVTSIGDALKQAHEQKDILLLISDFHLGNGEFGTEVIRSIRSVLGRDVKAFLMTGDTSSRAQIIARKNDARLISKPINADEFLALLGRN